MSDTHVLVPISSNKIVEVSALLAQRESSDTISRFFEKAADYLMDNLEWKSDDDLPILTKTGKGYRWKSLFLPDGTQLRMKYSGSYYYAAIEGDTIRYDGKSVSPSEFTYAVTRTARNAWRDIEIMRAGDSEWISADRLR